MFASLVDVGTDPFPYQLWLFQLSCRFVHDKPLLTNLDQNSVQHLACTAPTIQNFNWSCNLKRWPSATGCKGGLPLRENTWNNFLGKNMCHGSKAGTHKSPATFVEILGENCHVPSKYLMWQWVNVLYPG